MHHMMYLLQQLQGQAAASCADACTPHMNPSSRGADCDPPANVAEAARRGAAKRSPRARAAGGHLAAFTRTKRPSNHLQAPKGTCNRHPRRGPVPKPRMHELLPVKTCAHAPADNTKSACRSCWGRCRRQGCRRMPRRTSCWWTPPSSPSTSPACSTRCRHATRTCRLSCRAVMPSSSQLAAGAAICARHAQLQESRSMPAKLQLNAALP